MPPQSTRTFLLGLAVGLTLSFLLVSLNVMHVRTSMEYSTIPSMQSLDRDRTSRVRQVLQADARQGGPHDHDTMYNKVNNGSQEAFKMADDQHFHHDDDTVARKLAKKVRVLIWVMTAPKNLDTKAKKVRDTWGKRADKLIFFSSENNAKFPTVGLDVEEGRSHLTAKTMQGFRYVYHNHLNDADWFMKVDDDTYVVVENLRYFLASQNPDEPIFFGHHFQTLVKQGYYSGGGGYVLSKEALRRLAVQGSNSSVCRQDGGAEDAELGACMLKLGVKTANTTDALGRSRFHCFDPETHLFGGYPDWYYKYDANGAKKGGESISDYAITFHYVSPEKMTALEFYIYHLRPYGIQSGDQELNSKLNPNRLLDNR